MLELNPISAVNYTEVRKAKGHNVTITNKFDKEIKYLIQEKKRSCIHQLFNSELPYHMMNIRFCPRAEF